MFISSRIIAAGAIALVAAGGSAFTAAGLGTSGQAAGPQFVGGQVSQSVTGAVLGSIVYDFVDGTHTGIKTVTLTFDAAAAGKVPHIAFAGGNAVAADGSAVAQVEGTGPYISVVDLTGTPETGATGIAVSVPSS